MLVKHEFHTTPYRHQEHALDLSLDREFYAFFMEMGTGKSKVLVDTIFNLHIRGKLDFALIIAPKGVYNNWTQKEIPEHGLPGVRYRVIQWFSGANKKQLAEMRKVANRFAGLTVFVMNIEACSLGAGKDTVEWLSRLYGARGMIAIDESTGIKNPKAKRTKTLIKAARFFRYRRLLTGSPATRSPMDLWSQAQFLKPSLLGSSFISFQAQYAMLRRRVIPGRAAFNQIVGYQNLDRLAEEIRGWSYRVLKKECLDLPEKIYTVREVDLTPEQRRHYENLRQLALTELQSGELVSAPLAVTRLLRLQQVVCGHLPHEDGEPERIPSNRVQAVVDIAEETEGKMVVWCRFVEDIRLIEEALSKAFGDDSVVTYYGATKNRQEVIQEFQDPEHPVRFFVGNQQTGGRGITLTEASVVVYYANTFNLEERLQSEDRAHRIGQKNSVLYVDLVSRGTVDEKIVSSLQNKIDLSAKVLGEEAQAWLEMKPPR